MQVVVFDKLTWLTASAAASAGPAACKAPAAARAPAASCCWRRCCRAALQVTRAACWRPVGLLACLQGRRCAQTAELAMAKCECNNRSTRCKIKPH
jgi:hypothetical protein